MFSSEINKEISYKNEKNIEFIEQKEVKTSRYWVIDPIVIDNNWSETESTYDWCNGSGSYSDPYVIENVTINGLNSSSCIEIRNSDAFFIIRNCTLYNSTYGDHDAGIYLEQVEQSSLHSNISLVLFYSFYTYFII